MTSRTFTFGPEHTTRAPARRAPPRQVPHPPAADDAGRLGRVERATRVGSAAVVVAICGLISWHVVIRAQSMTWYHPIGLYTLVVSSYVTSRFVLAACYRPPREAGLEPPVAIVVPAFNEGEAVVRTIDSCLGLDYPKDKIEVVVVNDGSTDDTWEHMQRACSRYPAGTVRCIDLGSNQGKRAAMAAGIRATSAEILLFVDSDSMPAANALRRLVQAFADPRVGAAAGITHVRNATTNALTKMQAARYYVSFQLLKTAESVFGAVSCCPGCFAAYRREAILPLLEGWEHQRFLGARCTHGDDRALTNRVLRAGWRSVYDATAEAWTDAPEAYRTFFRQQLRWKKSWSREGPILLSHIWRSRPPAFPSVLIATTAGLASPFVMTWNLFVHPFLYGLFPALYVLALYLVAASYGLLLRSQKNNGLGTWAVIGTFFYVAFSFQILWALVRLRDGSWGTRSA